MASIIQQLTNINVIKANGALNSNLKIILNKNQDVLHEVHAHTAFLNNIYHPVTLYQRIYTIVNRIATIPTCNNENCNNVVKFKRKYNEYCSLRCGGLSRATQDKRKKTTLKNYGVENPSQSELIKQKKVQTCLNNYGVENPFESDVIKEQITKTCKAKYGKDYYVQTDDFRNKFTNIMNVKYGVDHALQSPEIFKKANQTLYKNFGVLSPLQSLIIKRAANQTCFENNGVEHALQSPAVREKVAQTCMVNYGVEYPIQSSEIRERMKRTCLDRYGVEYAIQSLDIQEKIKQTCMVNFGVEFIAQAHISIDVLNMLNDITWLYEQHFVQQKTLMQISQELNVSDSMVGKYLHNHGLDTQNYFQSTGEKAVLNFINSLNVETVSNSRSIIPPYELDIYIPEHNLAIEYCGLYWHSEQAGKDKHYHKRKYDLCAALGIQLITMFEDEWFTRQEQVKAKLKVLLGKDDRLTVYARKTQIVNVSKESKKIFFEQNHIQGSGLSSIGIGLMYNNELVACMLFLRRKEQDYELSRYATSARVVGGFSKLLAYFKKTYTYNSIISFADLRWSVGNLYYKNGWSADSIIKPDYQYSSDAKHRIHKFNFRRKNLPKLLKEFNPVLTERENCDNNGILRIWDCGKIRFIID